MHRNSLIMSPNKLVISPFHKTTKNLTTKNTSRSPLRFPGRNMSQISLKENQSK